MWFMEEPSQFSVGQTAQSLTCSIIDKPHTGLDECPTILLSCFRARNSDVDLKMKVKKMKSEGRAVVILVLLAVTVGDAHMNEPVYAPGVPPKKDGQLNKRTKIQGDTSPGKPQLG